MKKTLFFLFCCSALLLHGCGGSAPAMDTAGNSSVQEYSLQTADCSEDELITGYSATAQEPKTETEVNVVEDGMNYFTFHTDTKIYQNEDGQDLLWETFTDPEFYSPDTRLYDWVNGVLDDICKSELQLSQDLLVYAEEEQERIGENFYSFSHYLNLGVGRHDTKVASVLALSSIYSGGPHPSTVQTAVNLDMKELKVLTLEDVLVESSEQLLLEMVLDSVRQKFTLVGEEGLYSDYEVTVQNALTYGNMTSHWYFNETGLVIFFNQYVLGPYASGLIKAVLPYESLADVLRPEFLPQACAGLASGVQISKEAPAEGEICTISFGSGDTLYLRVEGTASKVQLSQVFFAEGTPVGETMLFSANFLDETVTIALQGDWRDTETIYGVEYSDEKGGPHVIYSTSADVWAEQS